MKEKDRQLIVERIQKDIEERKLLQEKYNKLQNLLMDPQVLAYISLSEDIKKIERRQSIFKNSLKETINIEFNRALNNRTKDKQISPCNHDIWLYQGSYYMESDLWCDCEYESLVANETNEKFEFNRYMCLENYDKHHDCTYYRNLYYQYLYKLSIEKSKNHIIDEFNKDKELSKIKKLTKKIINE